MSALLLVTEKLAFKPLYTAKIVPEFLIFSPADRYKMN